MTNDFLDQSYWNGMIKMSLSRLFILRTLYDGPLHGYALSKRIAEITRGCCAPTEGALYPALHEFEREDCLTCHSEVVGGRSRKVYTLTEKGIQACLTGLRAWEETARALLAAKRNMQADALDSDE